MSSVNLFIVACKIDLQALFYIFMLWESFSGFSNTCFLGTCVQDSTCEEAWMACPRPEHTAPVGSQGCDRDTLHAVLSTPTSAALHSVMLCGCRESTVEPLGDFGHSRFLPRDPRYFSNNANLKGFHRLLTTRSHVSPVVFGKQKPHRSHPYAPSVQCVRIASQEADASADVGLNEHGITRGTENRQHCGTHWDRQTSPGFPPDPSSGMCE